MTTHREALQAAFDSGDLDALVALVDERVVWRGAPGIEYVGGHEDHSARHDHPHDGDHDHPPMCTNREEALDVFERFLAGGASARPAVIAESGDSLVVDPRLAPPLPFPLHLAFTFRGARIVLIQDYPDRDSALADVVVVSAAG